MTHSRDVIRRLLADGWVRNHVKGSHQQFKHPRKPGKVTVPHPNRDLPAGTLAAPGILPPAALVHPCTSRK